MATVDELLNCEASQIGVCGTDNPYNTWIWGHPCYDPDTYPWCAAFQSWCMRQVGIDMSPTASAAGVLNQFPRVGDDDVQPGDVVCFNWDGRSDTGWMDHVGIVEWFDHSSGYFGTIEGNTGGGEGCVMRCTRYNYGNYFTAFSRPSFGSPTPIDTPHQTAGDPINNNGFYYRAHVQNLGWCDAVHDGQTAGTTGCGLRLEALKMRPPEGLEMNVKMHIQKEGWREWNGIKAGAASGEGSSDIDPIMGTTGESLRAEAIEIDTVKNTTGKTLKYRVHLANYGWTGWIESGFTAGTVGISVQIEAIQIVLE